MQYRIEVKQNDTLESINYRSTRNDAIAHAHEQESNFPESRVLVIRNGHIEYDSVCGY